MTSSAEDKPASTELTGRAGVSYEDIVVACFLGQLFRRERAGHAGFVTSVAVERPRLFGPLDDRVDGSQWTVGGT